MANVRQKLMGKAALLAAAIETPFALWLAATQKSGSLTMVIPMTFHLPSGFLVALVLRPFKGLIPDPALLSISLPAMFVVQTILIAVVLYFRLRRRERRRAASQSQS
jgi:hypothetical protein